MKFIADLHVHSRFSRATSRQLDLESLHVAAQQKGIQVLATGDATHPGWFDEIQTKLVPAEPGLYRLGDALSRVCDASVPARCRGTVRFILSSEISNIYKKDGRTRKNHNLVFLPDLAAAERFNARLERIGNIRSDGRPILGLDARDLLEIVLDTDPRAYLVPAHIWTPWFSMLGSKSGFDSLEACFADLSQHVFAAETGLSSDPAMNWRVSSLDRLTLISNSDAHSPSKLGREANRFDTELSFDAIRAALEHPETGAFQGTYEFYPEEGKYHLDGHRNCGVCLRPYESRRMDGICPVCHRPLTLGVLHRVEYLADRTEGFRPETAAPFVHLVPLTDILSEVLQCGSATKKVAAAYRRALERLGSEFEILQELPLEDIRGADIPLLSEALERIRNGQMSIDGGYDGEFGTIRIFTPGERRRILGQKSLFGMPQKAPEKCIQENPEPIQKDLFAPAASPLPSTATGTDRLNALQQAAVDWVAGPLMVVAGPGTGKTFSLTRCIVRLMAARVVSADRILAVTFTQKAADEMRRRIVQQLGKGVEPPAIGTFHALCFKFLRELEPDREMSIVDEDQRLSLIRDAMDQVTCDDASPPFSARQMHKWIQEAKQQVAAPEHGGPEPDDEGRQRLYLSVFKAYQHLLAIQGLYDFDDLVAEMVIRLERDGRLKDAFRERFSHVLVDEYQDLNLAQYRLVRALTAEKGNLFVIGDPDQCIYGFRGSDLRFFDRFTADYPDAQVIRLNHSYRAPQSILDAAGQVMARSQDARKRIRLMADVPGRRLGLIRTDSEKAEAVAIGRVVEAMVGGSGFEAINFGKVDANGETTARSFADFAVLYRTHDQGAVIADVFENAGIPFQLSSRRTIIDTAHVAGLVALLRVLADRGSFYDLTQTLSWLHAAPGAAAVKQFRQWCYSKQFRPDQGLVQAARLPIDGMSARRQHRLVQAAGELQALKTAARALVLFPRINYLIENTKLSQAFATSPAEAGRSALAAFVEASQDEADFISRLTLFTDTDVYDARAERVALLSLHAAKGLEFDVVFIAGCEDGLLPLRRPGLETDLAEERRLFYVGLTRARQRLYLCAAARRTLHGRTEVREFSPFIADIEASLKEDQRSDHGASPKRRQIQMNLF